MWQKKLANATKVGIIDELVDAGSWCLPSDDVFSPDHRYG
jgi:hypothetical protein